MIASALPAGFPKPFPEQVQAALQDVVAQGLGSASRVSTASIRAAGADSLVNGVTTIHRRVSLRFISWLSWRYRSVSAAIGSATRRARP